MDANRAFPANFGDFREYWPQSVRIRVMRENIMNEKQMHRNATLKQLAKAVASLQSFEYDTFDAARETVNIDGAEYVFDKLSLCDYTHNLSTQDYRNFGKYLCHFFEEAKLPDDIKAREEYAVLFDLSSHYRELKSMKILKTERPDFVLGDSGEIGIEVTRLTTESESVMRRISKENFGKGRTAADIRANAKKVHGGKAENYSYFDLGEAVAVGESLIDLSERYKIYSERIVNKYHKYKELFCKYKKFIVLCNAVGSFCLTSKEISEEILALAKETEPNLGGFTLCILRTDSDGKSEVDSFCL